MMICAETGSPIILESYFCHGVLGYGVISISLGGKNTSLEVLYLASRLQRDRRAGYSAVNIFVADCLQVEKNPGFKVGKRSNTEMTHDCSVFFVVQSEVFW